MTVPNICMIAFENKPEDLSTTFPKIFALVSPYLYHMGYFDDGNPSAPNYAAITFADSSLALDDGKPYNLSNPSIYGNLTAAHIPWEVYFEGITTSNCYTDTSNNYTVKHGAVMFCHPFNMTANTSNPYSGPNPAALYSNVDSTNGRTSKIANAGSLGTAFSTSGNLSDFSKSSTFANMLASMNSAKPANFYWAGPALPNQSHGSGSPYAAPWTAGSASPYTQDADAFGAYMITQIMLTSWYTSGHGNIIIWFDEGSHSGTTGEQTNLALISAKSKGQGAFGSSSLTLDHAGLLLDLAKAYNIPNLPTATKEGVQGSIVTGHPPYTTGSIYSFLDLAGGGGGGGTPNKVVFGQEPPASAVQNAVFTPPVTVLIQDINGGPTTSNANVSLAIGTNPPPGTGVLTGGGAVAALSGTATFPGLSINTVNSSGGYTLVASSGSLVTATSSPATSITSSVGAPAELLIAQQPPAPPATTTTGTSIFPAISVKICDSGGTQTGSTASVTVAIGTNAGSPAGTLGGTLTATSANGGVVAGLATFANLTLDQPGNGYTLVFTCPSLSLTPATSNGFNIVAAAATRDPLVQAFVPTSIWNQPIGSNAVFILPQPTSAQATLFPATIKDMANDPTVVVMTPTAPATAIHQDTALWTGRSRCAGATDDTGTVLATAPIPNAFTVPGTIGGNYGISVVSADGHTYQQGEPFARCVAGSVGTVGFMYTKTIEDLYGNGILGGKGGSGLSDLGGVLRLGELIPGGKIPHALAINIDGGANEVNSFRWPATKKDGYTYTPGGTNPSLCPGVLLALKPTFNLTTLTSGPGLILGAAFQNYGAYVVNDTGRSVNCICTEYGPNGLMTDEFLAKWAIPFNTAGAGGTDAWSKDLRAIYANLFIVDNNSATAIGGGGTVNPTLVALPLTSQGGGSGQPAALGFLQGPTSIPTAGGTMSPSVTVQILDNTGKQTTSNAGVSVAIGTNPPPGGILTGGGSVAANSGLATFAGLSVDTANTSGAYTLVASSPSLGFTSPASTGFQVGALVGLPDHLAISAVTTTNAGATIPTVTVQILDKGGNQTKSTASVVIAIGTNPPPGGTLSGTLTATLANGKVVSGLASFTDLSINTANTSGGYTLVATCPSLGITAATSNTFNILGGGGPGTPTELLFALEPPAYPAANAQWSTTVQIANAQNGPTPTIANITLALGANPSKGALAGTLVATSDGTGLATFTGLSINNAGANYTLVATCTNPSLTFATSNFITVTSTADLFTVLPPIPVVTGISPATGPQTGGTLVTITGSGFTGTTEVDFGTSGATNVVVVNDTTITCISPVEGS